MTVEEEIEVLKQRADEARQTAEILRKRYEDAAIAAYPIKVGDVIRSAKGSLARVTAVYLSYGVVKWAGVLRNSDGIFGKRPAPYWMHEWACPEVVKEGVKENEEG